MSLRCLFVAKFKSGKTQSFLTGSTFRGEALKDRSEGSWRSGRRRSGDVGGGGTVNVFRYSVSCRLSLEHTLCHEFLTIALRLIKGDCETRRRSLSVAGESSCRAKFARATTLRRRVLNHRGLDPCSQRRRKKAAANSGAVFFRVLW